MSNLKSVEQAAKKLIEIMESGVNPWVKPWNPASDMFNPVSKKPFTGFNWVMLNLFSSGYKTGFYITFNQAKQVGGNVRKGEKAIPVLMPLIFDKKDENGQKTNEKVLAGFKEYYVFNLDQCENVDSLYPQHSEKANNIIENCEITVRNTGASIQEANKDSCFYVPSMDFVNMVNINQFESSEKYYATLFHELSHWTGHESRLARDFSGRFGDSAYALEELTAELSANYLCQYHGIDGIDSHNAAYLKHWIRVLKEDSSVLLKVASASQKASDFILKGCE